MIRPLEAQVLMSGIEVDGWQLFLKEAMGGLIRAAGQLCLAFFYLPNLDLCQNSVMFSGRFSEILEFVTEFRSNFGKFIAGPNVSPKNRCSCNVDRRKHNPKLICLETGPPNQKDGWTHLWQGWPTTRLQSSWGSSAGAPPKRWFGRGFPPKAVRFKNYGNLPRFLVVESFYIFDDFFV